MNRYPLWKNLMIIVVLIIGFLYTLPNFFGEVPAVQVSSAKTTIKIDGSTKARIERILTDAGIASTGVFSDPNSIRVRFQNPDIQLKAKDAIEQALNPDPENAGYVVALNLVSASPAWLTSINALPMYLGLDLRGGVHFLLEVDMDAALTKRMDAVAGDMRTLMRDERIRHRGIRRVGNTVEVRFQDAEQRAAAREVIAANLRDLQLDDRDDSDTPRLIGSLTIQAAQELQKTAVQQNIITLNNRVNELGVAEPVIQQQGIDRIVVQLPGVQDVAKAKELIGRTATLEIRMVDQDANASGVAGFGTESFPERQDDGSTTPVIVKKDVVLTGDRITSASAGFDQNQRPSVSVNLDAAGGRIMKYVTRENLGKPMAIILFEKGKGEAISVATIQGEFSDRFQITGNFTPTETNDLAILLRSGALAAPMEIIEERTVGPSLGAENIEKGFNSTLWGFVAIAVFMIAYYMIFGLVSVLALSANLLLLVALLSVLQATLTLPGIAAIALTLGMAIDANVLINERIREELRNGSSPQAAISAGYDRAFDTILDSNITTLIAGVALLVFGSGPVRGFAVVHCLGILTSMFSAILVSRMLTNFIYGRRRKIDALSIGQVWKPNN
ncbi:protein translocase subunit SecD [Nitrogeniibacter aestuarii]|uniref:protein translocase subunit SecD n=1 Tax=Nitrogeniibacter aestuarii TaxID=2815343 RepID=UPI001D1185AF|nr:protein translocase subunit SecD [Nitrogeniibacter aestuarii]